MSMCGMLGRRSPAWTRWRPTSKRGAASSRPDTNWLEADASIVTAPPRDVAVPCTVNGSAPCPSSSMSTPSVAQRRDRSRPSGGGGRSRRRRTSSARGRAPATGGRKRMTVPAGPQSIVVRAEQLVGGDDDAGRRRTRRCPAPLDAASERAQRLDHAARCRGVQRRAQRRRTVGERREDELAIGQRLRAGERDDGLERAGGDGCAPPASGSVCRSLAVRIELWGGIPSRSASVINSSRSANGGRRWCACRRACSNAQSSTHRPTI